MKIKYHFVVDSVESEPSNDFTNLSIHLNYQKRNINHKEMCHHCLQKAHNITDTLLSLLENTSFTGKNRKQGFAERIIVLSKTHPVIAWILNKVFLTILVSIITNMTCSAIGQVLSQTNAYEKPHASSPAVYHVEVKQNVIVVGDALYYYEVETQDESTGCCYTGYVSKRSVSLMESKVESFTVLDEK